MSFVQAPATQVLQQAPPPPAAQSPAGQPAPPAPAPMAVLTTPPTSRTQPQDTTPSPPPKPTNKSEEPGPSDEKDSELTEEERDEKKLFARMRGKAYRLCTRSSTGKLKVSEDLALMWQQTGKVQRDMIKIMMEADGDKVPSHHGMIKAVVKGLGLQV